MKKRPSSDGTQGKPPGKPCLDKAWKEIQQHAAEASQTFNVSPPQGNIYPGEPKPNQKKEGKK